MTPTETLQALRDQVLCLPRLKMLTLVVDMHEVLRLIDEALADAGGTPATLRIETTCCADCGAPLVWAEAWQAAECVLCARREHEVRESLW